MNTKNFYKKSRPTDDAVPLAGAEAILLTFTPNIRYHLIIEHLFTEPRSIIRVLLMRLQI